MTKWTTMIVVVLATACSSGEDDGAQGSTPSWGELIEWCEPVRSGSTCQLEPRGGICGGEGIHLTRCSCDIEHSIAVGLGEWCCWAE